jgi:hypothetical protein
MRIEHKIVIHISDEAKTEWEKDKHENEPYIPPCPSCEINSLKESKRKKTIDSEKDYNIDKEGDNNL